MHTEPVYLSPSAFSLVSMFVKRQKDRDIGKWVFVDETGSHSYYGPPQQITFHESPAVWELKEVIKGIMRADGSQDVEWRYKKVETRI
jgi:hypothetical protein